MHDIRFAGGGADSEEMDRRSRADEQITVRSGDFLKDPLPKADVITMGMILHDWNLEKKKQLIRLAYEALPENGALVAIENLIDDDGAPMPLDS